MSKTQHVNNLIEHMYVSLLRGTARKIRELYLAVWSWKAEEVAGHWGDECLGPLAHQITDEYRLPTKRTPEGFFMGLDP